MENVDSLTGTVMRLHDITPPPSVFTVSCCDRLVTEPRNPSPRPGPLSAAVWGGGVTWCETQWSPWLIKAISLTTNQYVDQRRGAPLQPVSSPSCGEPTVSDVLPLTQTLALASPQA